MTEKEKTGRERLERMLAEYERLSYEHHEPVEESIEYSKKYLQAIRRMLQGSICRFSYHVGRRIAVLVLAAMLTLGFSLTSYAGQQPLRSYLQSQFFDKNYAQEGIWIPQYLPEGFALSQRFCEDMNATTVFSDRNQNEIVFTQMENAEWEYDVEQFRTIFINDIAVASYEDDAKRIYVWAVGCYVFQYSFPNFFSEEECRLIVEKTREHSLGAECREWESVSNHCTKGTHCLLCLTSLQAPAYGRHDIDESIRVNIGNPLYHQVSCFHVTVSGTLCEAVLLEVHQYDHGHCELCGYKGGIS